MPYEGWARSDWLEVTPGRAIDKRYVVKQLAELCQKYDVQAVAYDRWGMEEIRRLLDEMGLWVDLVAFGQTYADMSPAVAALEAGIIGGTLRHSGNPVMVVVLSGTWWWKRMGRGTGGSRRGRRRRRLTA